MGAVAAPAPGKGDGSTAQAAGVHNINNSVVLGEGGEGSEVAASAVGILSDASGSRG